MDNLLKEIDNLVREEKDKKKKMQLTEFARRIRYKWCEASFKYAYYYEVGKAGNYQGKTGHLNKILQKHRRLFDCRTIPSQH
jgi:hypothetical protein